MKPCIIIVVLMTLVCSVKADELTVEYGKVFQEFQLKKLKDSSNGFWVSGSTIRTSRGDVEQERLHFVKGKKMLIIETMDGKVTRIGDRILEDKHKDVNFFEEKKLIRFYDWKNKNPIQIELGEKDWSSIREIKASS